MKRLTISLTCSSVNLFLLGTGNAWSLPWRYQLETSLPTAHKSHRSNGAVASESSICSQIGIDLIQHGGNAADAMVGTTLCVGVIGMYHSGIGGGGYMLVRDSNGEYESIDYREAAPAAAFEDMYQGNIRGSVFGGLSAGVPGDLRGLEYLHKKYGVLPWRTVVNPAVRVARYGFNVTEDLVRYMKAAISYGGNFLVDDPVWAEDFARDGRLIELGEIITRKRYANTLEEIGQKGVDVFYEGEMAESMVKIIQETNGTMTLDDFKNYKALVRKTVDITFRGFKVFSTSAPSAGTICLSVLKTMEQYPVSDLSDTNLTIHRLDEAMRFAYAARTELGDPDYVSNVALYEDRLLSTAKAKEIRHKILDNTTQPVEAYNPSAYFSSSGHGTSHIVTTDKSGMAVSSTTTVNLLFGAQIMTPDSGIIINNEMNDFSIPGVSNEFGFPPAPANYIRPGKRPLSSINPVIAEYPNGTLALVTGAAGGSRITSATMQAAWYVLEYGMSMAEALAEPRLHDQLIPNVVTVEYSFDNGTAASLIEKGHNVSWIPSAASSMQGIRRHWNGTFESAGEPRQANSGGLTT